MRRHHVRWARIALYIVAFLVFVLLFSYYGNVQIGSQEFFAPRSPAYLYAALILLGVVLMIAFLLWRASKK